MAQQTKVRSTTTVSWADAVNNNATWNTNWQITEYAKFAVSDLGLANSKGGIGLKIEEILFFGTGTTPALANRDDIQIIIATDSGFNDVVCIELGIQSDAKYDTTKCIAGFSPGHEIYLQDGNTTELYCTVKCGTGAALTATSARLTVSQL